MQTLITCIKDTRCRKYDAKVQTLERLGFNPIRQRLSYEGRFALNLRKYQRIETLLRKKKQSNNNAAYLRQGVLGVMHLPLAQPVPYSDSRRPQDPSDHNTRWRLLNINHNFMIKSKTLSNTSHRRHDKSLRCRWMTSRRDPATSIILQQFDSFTHIYLAFCSCFIYKIP